MNSDFEDIKREVAAANRVLANLGLAVGITAALGHASMRIPSEPNHFFVKGREYEFDALAIMEPDDMVMCDTEGFLIAGRAGLAQCSCGTSCRFTPMSRRSRVTLRVWSSPTCWAIAERYCYAGMGPSQRERA